MAQTTRLASFGPVLVIVAFLLIASRVFRRVQPINTKKCYLIYINHEKKKGDLLNGPNDASGVVWARFRCPCPIHHVFSF